MTNAAACEVVSATILSVCIPTNAALPKAKNWPVVSATTCLDNRLCDCRPEMLATCDSDSTLICAVVNSGNCTLDKVRTLAVLKLEIAAVRKT